MALDFQFLSLKKDFNNRHYNARIEFNGQQGNYDSHTNAKFYFYDWLDNQINVLDGEDRAFNEELPYLHISGKGIEEIKHEKNLEKAILKFIEKECSEKT